MCFKDDGRVKDDELACITFARNINISYGPLNYYRDALGHPERMS